MDLLYFLKVLYRRKWIILLLTLIAISAGFIFLLFKKPLYESVAQYSTGFTAQKVTMFDGSAGIDLYTADVKFDNVIETFKSPRVIGMLSYRLLLHDLENPSSAYRKLALKKTQTQLYTSTNIDSTIRILHRKIDRNELLRSDDANEKKILSMLELYRYDFFELRKFLFINRVERTDYLNIVFRSENPELSAVVVNTMGEEFINYYRNLNFQRSEENVASIKDLVSQQQNKIDSLDKTLLNETISQGTIDPVSRSTSAMETVKELETKLAEEKSKYNQHSNRLDYLRERLKVMDGNSTASNTTSAASNDEVIRLTNKKNDLVDEYERKGGTDADLERKINDLRTEIILKSNSGSTKSKDKGDVDGVKNQISEETAMMNAASSTINDYNEKIRKYMGMTNVSPGSSVRINVIKDKLEMENKQLSSFKEKYSQAQGLSRDDPTTNFKQTLIGQPAVEPEPRKAIMTLGLSGISMLFLTSVIFLFLEIFDTSLKTSSNFSKTVNLNLASILNNISMNQRIADTILEENTGRKSVGNNLFKNNIRKLRHEIADSGKQVFLITSTKKRAGKSTVIEALAMSLLLTKKKVLLIDLNFSNNTLTKTFNASTTIQDITNKFNYKLPFSQQNIKCNSNYPGLDIIGCNEGNFTPSEVLYNIKMDLLLDVLKKEYDFILIEGAPLNNYADSKELSDYAEGVYTVFSADSSISQTDKESIQFLYSLKEKNFGSILNKVQTENLNF